MLDYNLLKSKARYRGMSTAELSRRLKEAGTEISVPTMYNKMNGITEFTRCEIQAIKEVLNLSDAEVMDIFFDGEETR